MSYYPSFISSSLFSAKVTGQESSRYTVGHRGGLCRCTVKQAGRSALGVEMLLHPQQEQRVLAASASVYVDLFQVCVVLMAIPGHTEQTLAASIHALSRS